MNESRFWTSIRLKQDKALPYVAYITDRATGMKFSNAFDKREDAEEWIDGAKRILTKE